MNFDIHLITIRLCIRKALQFSCSKWTIFFVLNEWRQFKNKHHDYFLMLFLLTTLIVLYGKIISFFSGLNHQNSNLVFKIWNIFRNISKVYFSLFLACKTMRPIIIFLNSFPIMFLQLYLFINGYYLFIYSLLIFFYFFTI